MNPEQHQKTLDLLKQFLQTELLNSKQQTELSFDKINNLKQCIDHFLQLLNPNQFDILKINSFLSTLQPYNKIQLPPQNPYDMRIQEPENIQNLTIKNKPQRSQSYYDTHFQQKSPYLTNLNQKSDIDAYKNTSFQNKQTITSQQQQQQQFQQQQQQYNPPKDYSNQYNQQIQNQPQKQQMQLSQILKITDEIIQVISSDNKEIQSILEQKN